MPIFFSNGNDWSKLNRREDQIESLIAPAVAALGCELWGLEYLSQGSRSRLRVYIERPDGVTVDDCERVSREVSDLLDVEDAVPGSYTLEVSSPGMDRILFKAGHYLANVGAVVDIRLNFPFEGRKHIVGVLAGFEDDEVIVRPLCGRQAERSSAVRPQNESPAEAGSGAGNGEGNGEEYVLPLENIHRARLVPQFD